MVNSADGSSSGSESRKGGKQLYLKRKRISELELFKEEIRAMLLAQEKKFDKILKSIEKSNQIMEKSVSLLTEQNEEYRKKIELLENKLQEDKKYIILLEEKVEDMQMNSRKANFEIRNVPKRPSETKDDLITMVECLSTNIGSSLKRSDIKDIYRLRPKKDGTKNTSIVVETSSTLIKNEFLKMSKVFNIKHKTKLRVLHLGLKTSEDTPIFTAEHLTPRGSRLFFLARDLAKSKAYKYCWTAYGKVYIRKEDNAPIIVLRTEDQIQQLMQKQ